VKGNRNPAVSLPDRLAGQNDFCVSRVRVGFALTTIESFDNLCTAKRFMHRIAARIPGSYVVFSKTSKRVLCEVVSSSTRPLC
jgi:hypothetical protein